MSQRYFVDGDELAGRVRLGSADGFGSIGHNGEITTSQVEFDDPDGELDIPGWKPWAFLEDDCSYQTIHRGWTVMRAIERGDDRPSHRVNASRRITADVVDGNAALYFLPIHALEAKRPVETDIQRREWIRQSPWLAPYITDETAFLSDAQPATLDEADYRGMYPADVLNDCISVRFGKNYSLFWDEDNDGWTLFYGSDTDTIGTSTLRLSNVESDEDATTYLVAPNAKLERSPADTYSRVYLIYANGAVARKNTETAAEFIDRGKTVRFDRIGRRTTAEIFADRFLALSSTEEDRITCTISQIPATDVNLIRELQGVSARFSHLPGYEEFSTLRVISRTVRHVPGRRDLYSVDFLLGGKATAGPGGPGGGGGGPGGDPPYVPGPPSLVDDDCYHNDSNAPVNFGTTCVLPLSPSPAVGNTYLVALDFRGGNAPAAPSGWSAHPGNGQGGAGNDGIGVYYRVIESETETSVTFGSGAFTSVVEVHWAQWSGLGSLLTTSSHEELPEGNSPRVHAGSFTTTGAAFAFAGIAVKRTADINPPADFTPDAGVEKDCYAHPGMPSTPTGHPLLLVLHQEITAAGTYELGATRTTLNTDNHLGLTLVFETSSDSAPFPHQRVCEQFTGDGSTTDFTLNHPYLQNSLDVKVGNIPFPATQDDPNAGEFSLSFAPALGVPIVACYDAGAGPPTGEENPAPDTTGTLIAPQLLGSGAIGDGLQALTDNQTWQPFEWAIRGGLSKYTLIEDAGSASTLDLDNANYFFVTLTEDADLSFDNVPAIDGRVSAVTVVLTLAGFTPTFTDTIAWATEDGLPPEWPTDPDASVVAGFLTADGGTTWRAGLMGSGGPSIEVLDDLDDVTITSPQENDTLRYRSGAWVNDDRRWEPVTFNFGSGPELVWDGDDLVMEWKAY